ncbi:MAG: 1-(5-phosphoribosyl)-5-[(5-phosphoribosylamino)methylideneamino]imidazole-4-carboxamide isomerase [Syntrophomonadaceae bacterium]|nr:1-(5-phosphoribosyl)-5-[(5-phosphoribosylamino)methylideneamino]imidazole-4-carboxamide isomerase [Syntrophomonadaceae bacterium]MDD3889772.1 1-(5-phosphoribosyl)-5-[(5-phosphoribosylamino)methylideneamino]imidazole-4-carboxamide isomerase [Syntrophomonadaceae bacterium]MDD4548339.1 1-(5-phosphoribosyl)-5-[(5-phosphoribosylamino)methylideneamino]imidazole-4-carboxamide isomerase [Syntrophomonadaceae bacterium]
MIIYPAIDLKEGQCVRLVQGKAENKTVYSDTPAQVALSFQQQGAAWLHIVDLDGAFTGSPRNLEVISAIARAINMPFQVGGGLRTRDDVKRVLDVGAQRVIIGTRAVSSPEFIKQLLEEFGPERIIIGIDARDGMVAVEGWVTSSSLSALDFGKEMKSLGVKTTVFTDISRDGLLQGPNLDSTKEMAVQTGLDIIASGGFSSIQNIMDLKPMESFGVTGAIIGKALYDGKLSLPEVLNAAQ